MGKVSPPEVGWLALRIRISSRCARDPMPGPWQAIGEVDPDNRVRLLSDIRAVSGPLPARLYQGSGSSCIPPADRRGGRGRGTTSISA